MKKVKTLEISVSSGARMIKVGDDEIIFLSQLESYVHKGPKFKNYSLTEFECIVDIQKSKEENENEDTILKEENENNKNKTKKKRKKRLEHDLGKSHLLAKHDYKAFIRTKFYTPIYASIPSFTKDCFDVFGDSKEDREKAEKMNHLSKFLLATFVPWNVRDDGSIEMEFEFNNKGLLDLLSKWDNSYASEINKQRFRCINTILKRKQVSTKYKDAYSYYRGRNADWWYEIGKIKENNKFWGSKDSNETKNEEKINESKENDEDIGYKIGAMDPDELSKILSGLCGLKDDLENKKKKEKDISERLKMYDIDASLNTRTKKTSSKNYKNIIWRHSERINERIKHVCQSMKKKKIIEDDQFIDENAVIKINDDANDPLKIKIFDDSEDEKKFT